MLPVTIEHKISGDSGVTALSHMPELVELDLGWCTNIDANSGCVVNVIKNCKDISKLFLTAHRQTSDREITAIQEFLPDIQYLSIMGTRNVSSTSIENLSKCVTNLLLLDIGYCQQLEDQEFLTRIKSCIPNCHIVTSFNQV